MNHVRPHLEVKYRWSGSGEMVRLLAALLFIPALASGSFSPGPEQPCSKQFDSLLAAVGASSAQLSDLVVLAERKGIDCTYEYITLNTTNLFQTFVRFDYNNTEYLCEAYKNQYGPEGCAKGEALPCRELNKTLDVLKRAITDIKHLLNTPSLHRRPIPSHSMLGTVEKNGYLFRNGDPVFPGGYDHGSYKYYYGFPSEVVKQVIEVGQDSEEVVVSIASILPTEEVNNTEVTRVVKSFDRLYQYGLTSGLVIRCALPEWVITKYPDINRYMSSSCKYDIDHPMVRTLLQKALSPVVKELIGHPSLNSYRLGNEVYYRILGNQTVMSQYTVGKWHSWLLTKYKDISALNLAWNKTYKNFTEVFFPGKHNPKTGSIDPDEDMFGTAEWYDYCRFNADRVLDYYTWLISIIREIDQNAISHVKYVNEHLFSAILDQGLDRLALNKLTNWSGCDTRIETSPQVRLRTPSRNPGQYALDWLNTAIAYTWMRTTTPQKLVDDLEVHPITTSNYRNGSVPDNHMTAVPWIIHLHGLSLHLLWAWPRAANGSYLFDIVDSIPTLPQVVDEYARTLAYINALGPEVLALATAARPVCILWSITSSIQDKNYLLTQIDVFEALSFFGPQPSFIAEPDVDKMGVDAKCKVLVVPGQRYVTDTTVNAVHSFVEQGGHVVLVGNFSVFQYNEAGVKRPQSSLDWMHNLPQVPDQDPTKLLQHLAPHLIPAESELLVACLNSIDNTTAWGVLCRSTLMPNGMVVALVNVLTVPVSIILQVNGTAVTAAIDLYMYEHVDLKSPLVLQSLDVRIFELNTIGIGEAN